MISIYRARNNKYLEKKLLIKRWEWILNIVPACPRCVPLNTQPGKKHSCTSSYKSLLMGKIVKVIQHQMNIAFYLETDFFSGVNAEGITMDPTLLPKFFLVWLQMKVVQWSTSCALVIRWCWRRKDSYYSGELTFTVKSADSVFSKSEPTFSTYFKCGGRTGLRSVHSADSLSEIYQERQSLISASLRSLFSTFSAAKLFGPTSATSMQSHIEHVIFKPTCYCSTILQTS